MPSQVAALPVNVTPSFIVQAKLHRPRAANGLAPLLRIQQQLAHDLDRPFTLISAPAGFGKTTLLSEWLRAAPRPNAWLTLDEHDRDLVTFLTYLLAAIHTLFPDACPQTTAVLDVPTLPPISAISAMLNNEIDRLAETSGLAHGQRFILVLDDYHQISQQDIHQVVNDLLLRPPRPLHLVISTRHDPPLSLHTLRMRGEMVEIRTSTLRFTNAEIKTFVQNAVRVPVDSATVDQIARLTEGWGAGLRFAALALNANDSSDALATLNMFDHWSAMDYLSKEVFEHLPETMQAFLMQTAILERLNGALCDAVLDDPQDAGKSHQRLQSLESDSVFTSALADQSGWYRYHSLFRRLLLRQLAQRYDSAQIAALHRRASAWYAANGFVEDALHHALVANDVQGAAQIVEASRHAALNHSQFQRLEQWLKALPAQVIAERPGLLIIEAWLLVERWRTPDMNALLDAIEAMLPNTTMPEAERTILESEIAALRCDYCYFIGDRSGLLHLSRRALDIAPMTLSHVRRFAWMNYLAALQLQGDFKTLQAALHTSLREDRFHGDAFPISPLITYCAVNWMGADLTTLQQSAQRLLCLTQERNLFNEQGWAHLYLGCAAYQRNDLESASHFFTAIVNRPYNTHGHVFWQAALGLAAVHCAQGNHQQAQALSDSLLATAWEMGGANVLVEAQALQAFVAQRMGNCIEAQRWAASYDRSQPLAPMSMFSAPPLVLARILIDSALPHASADAAAWLDHIDMFSRETHNVRVQIEIWALRALLYVKTGVRADALAALEEAVRLAAPGGLVRVFLDLGAPLAPLLAELDAHGRAPELVLSILQAMPSTRAADDPATPAPAYAATFTADDDVTSHNIFIEPLTRRELEVFDLLAQRLTAAEIAERLVISENTVKRHRSNIYQKLGVNCRRDALSVARKLHLLDS